MTEIKNPVMDEVYAIRRKLSEECGHNPVSYMAMVQSEVQKAKDLGMSYLEYCLEQVNNRIIVQQNHFA